MIISQWVDLICNIIRIKSKSIEVPKQNPSQKDLAFTFNNERQKQVSIVTEEVIVELGKVVSSTEELLSPKFQDRVLAEVNNKTDGEDTFKFDEDQVDKKEIIKKTLTKYIEANIAIPQIVSTDEMYGGAEYQRFQLDLTPFNNLKPIHQQIVLMELLDRKVEDKGHSEFQKAYDILERYIMNPLMDDLSVPRDPELLLFFAKQVVGYIKTYTASEDELQKIMHYNGVFIADKVLGQMKQNIKYPEIKKVVKVKGNYTVLRPTKLLGNTIDGEMSFRNSPKDLARIRKYIFTSFEKCLYDKKKFDSNTERQFSKVLEDSPEVIKWDKLSDEQAREKIPLTYKKKIFQSHNTAQTSLLKRQPINT